MPRSIPVLMSWPTLLSPTVCSHSAASCSSVTFPMHGIAYSKVCGRAHAYIPTLEPRWILLSPSNNSRRLLHWRSVRNLWQSSKSHLDICCRIVKRLQLQWMLQLPLCSRATPSFIEENFFCESGSERHNWSEDALLSQQCRRQSGATRNTHLLYIPEHSH